MISFHANGNYTYPMHVRVCVCALGGGFGVRSSKGLIEVFPWVIKLRLVVGTRLWYGSLGKCTSWGGGVGCKLLAISWQLL